MKILLANSNTSPEVTRMILAEAERAASPGTAVTGCNARFGARVIGSRTEAAVSAHALVDMLAEDAPGHDAVVVGMSLDTGLWAARELLDVPVVGMTEAALVCACTMAPRVGLVVLGRNNAQPFRELVESYGLAGRLAGIAALEVTPEDRLRDPDALHQPVVDAATRLVERDGAEAVSLVGAVMVGLPRALEDRVPVPLIEGIACGVLLAETLVRLGTSKPRFGSLQAPAKRKVMNLGPALSQRLSR
jgi:allantoin racemase